MAGKRRESYVDIELNGAGISRSFSQVAIGDGDSQSDLFGIRVFRDGTQEALTGCSAFGYFIRPDGNTVIIQGTVDGNKAYVTLPASCYVYDGTFSLALKVTNGSDSITMRFVDGTIIRTTTDTIIDPGSVVPSVAEIEALIASANAAAAILERLTITNTLIEGTRYKLVVTLASS